MSKQEIKNAGKRKPLLAAFASVILLLLSCNKYLDVQPRAYIFADEAFSTPQGIQSALNGIYQQMSKPELYGEQLTLTTLDVMAQDYLEKTGFLTLVRLQYTNSQVKSMFASIWTSMYKNILNVNVFCAKLEDPGFHVLPEDQQNLMLGEAYAARAMQHLDLLRIFGPGMATNPNGMAIPYVRSVQFEATPILPAVEVVNEIEKDLQAAMERLQQDPIRTDAGIGTLRDRQRRLNYYAAKTLLARLYVYAGRSTQAWTLLEPELSSLDGGFKWITTTADAGNDRVFSKEAFFGIENRKLYDVDRTIFSALVLEDSIYAPAPEKFESVYPEINDLRRNAWFSLGTEGNKRYHVLVKYSDKDVSDDLRYFQPLIRKSEWVLLAAESCPDANQGLEILNTLRGVRGLGPLPPEGGREVLLNQIVQEYAREFWGEGQLFFAYKRTNQPSILGNDGKSTLAMGSNLYQVPLPDAENYYR